MKKQLPEYFKQLHADIRKDSHCGWSDSQKESIIKLLTPNEHCFPLFDEPVLPIQTRTTPSAIEMALRFKYEEEKAEITCG